MAYDHEIRDDIAADGPGINNPGVDPRAEQILPGTPVYDVAGEKIGAVDGAGFADGLLMMRPSSLFARRAAIPLDAIIRTDASGVHLSQTWDQLQRRSANDHPSAASTEYTHRRQRNARTRPTDMATDAGGARADLDVPPTPDPDEQAPR